MGKRSQALKLLEALAPGVYITDKKAFLRAPYNESAINTNIQKAIAGYKKPIPKELVSKMTRYQAVRDLADNSQSLIKSTLGESSGQRYELLFLSCPVLFTDKSQILEYMADRLKTFSPGTDMYTEFGISGHLGEDIPFSEIYDKYEAIGYISAADLAKVAALKEPLGSYLKNKILDKDQAIALKLKGRFYDHFAKAGRPVDPTIDAQIAAVLTGDPVYLSYEKAEEKLLGELSKTHPMFKYTYSGPEDVTYGFTLDSVSPSGIERTFIGADGNPTSEELVEAPIDMGDNVILFKAKDKNGHMNIRTYDSASNTMTTPVEKTLQYKTKAERSAFSTDLDSLRGTLAAGQAIRLKVEYEAGKFYEFIIGKTNPKTADIKKDIDDQIKATRTPSPRPSPSPAPAPAPAGPATNGRRTIKGVKPTDKQCKLNGLAEMNAHITNLLEFIRTNNIELPDDVQEKVVMWKMTTKELKETDKKFYDEVKDRTAAVLALQKELQDVIKSHCEYDPATKKAKKAKLYKEFIQLKNDHNIRMTKIDEPEMEAPEETTPVPAPKKNIYENFEEVKASTRRELETIAGDIITPRRPGESEADKVKKVEERADALYTAFIGSPVDEAMIQQRMNIAMNYQKHIRLLEALKVEYETAKTRLELAIGGNSVSGNPADEYRKANEKFIEAYLRFSQFCQTRTSDGKTYYEVASKTLGTLQAISIADHMTGKSHELLVAKTGDPTLDTQGKKSYKEYSDKFRIIEAKKKEKEMIAAQIKEFEAKRKSTLSKLDKTTYKNKVKELKERRRKLDREISDLIKEAYVLRSLGEDGKPVEAGNESLIERYEDGILGSSMLGRMGILNADREDGYAPKIDFERARTIHDDLFASHGLSEEEIMDIRTKEAPKSKGRSR